MGRVAKKAPEAVVEESPSQTVTQSRTRRTPKPNPKYANESVIIPPKLDAEEGEEGEEKPAVAEKVVKTVKKNADTPGTVTKGRGRPPVKKQKLEYEEVEAEEEKPAPDAAPRSTRSKVDPKDTLKVGDDSVAIIDVSDIISKAPTKPETPKVTPRGPGRKRTVPEESPKEDQAKKKKEEDKPSLITSRKSYMPAKKEEKEELEVIPEPEPEVKEEEAVKTPAPKTRRSAGPVVESPQPEPVEKKPKVEVKVEEAPKKLPVVRRNEQITKMTPATPKPITLPTKVLNNNTTIAVSPPKPTPRLLNSMVTPKGKQSPNVKLAGDGTDKKVFSIDLTDDSIREKSITLPVKASPLIRPSPAVKENIANNKPQPSTVLKDKLVSELNRMKASANLARRQVVQPSNRNAITVQNSAHGGARRITKFESWYVIDVKNLEPAPFRHTHKHSLIKLGNEIKQMQLPSAKWDYKITMQRRVRKENNNDEEIYTGDCGGDKAIEANREDFEPSSLLFKRSYREASKTIIDRSLMVKQNLYTITMNGKQCKLIGAPDDIKSIEDVEILLNIVDTCNLHHSCVELVTTQDINTIS